VTLVMAAVPCQPTKLRLLTMFPALSHIVLDCAECFGPEELYPGMSMTV
jgi:hypothetical protein